MFKNIKISLMVLVFLATTFVSADIVSADPGPVNATVITAIDFDVVPPTPNVNHSDIAPTDVDVTPPGPNINHDSIAPTDVDAEESTPPTNGGSGGSNGGGGRSRRAASTPVVAQVLGAADFQFLMNLSQGMKNNDVVELQARLRTEGFFTYPTNTGFFGPITHASVMAYQQAHFNEIGFVTGFVGPLTRAVLNK